MIKNRILQIFLFFIFLAISLIIFKKFNKYYSQNDFAKIIILVLLAINFFFGFAIKKFSKLSLIFLSYFLLIIYSVNSLLVYFDLQNTPKKQIEKILNKRGETFRFKDNGRREGLLKNKKAYLIITSGGTKLNSREDFLTPWLKFILNFFGIEKVEIVSADQMALDYEKSVKEAEDQINKIS